MKSPAEFKGIMPYANDMLGIYQLLRRWAFRILGNRFEKFRNALYPYRVEQPRLSQHAPLPRQLDRVTGVELATDTGPQALSISDRKPLAFVSEVKPPQASDIDSGIARLLQRDIGSDPPRDWTRLITTASMTTRLEKLKAIVATPDELQNFPDIAEYVQNFNQAIGPSDQAQLMQSLFEKEARISSYLTFLTRHKPTQLNELFFTGHRRRIHPGTPLGHM